MTIFEQIITGQDVEAAAEVTLRRWFPTYLAEIERQKGKEPHELPLPRSYQTTPEFDKWPESQLPAVILVAPGLREEPDREARGKHRARWALGVAVVVSADTQGNTNLLAKLYAGAVRALLIQRPSMEGFARGVDWLDETYDDLPSEDERTLAAGQVIFSVEVADVVTAHGGPPAPDPTPDPYEEPEPVTIEEVHIEHDRGEVIVNAEESP